MLNEQQYITIKGTKEGLTILVDEEPSFVQIYEQLSRLLEDVPYHRHEQKISVKIDLNNRYLAKDKLESLISLIEKDFRFDVVQVLSNVISKNDAMKIVNNNEVKVYRQMVRSGQVLNVTGHLLLVGNVNPGGEIKATGNIYVMGKLEGIAHAGTNGDDKMIIVASYMNPTQLRIANRISRSPDFETEGTYMEYGYYNSKKNRINIESILNLPSGDRDIFQLERGMLDG